jgi:hypothetical protein
MGQLIAADSTGGSAGLVEIRDLAAQSYDLIVPLMPAVVFGLAVLMLVWLVVVVFDVAATGGLVIQGDVALAGRPAAFREGMAQGFGVWGRTAALVALSVAPSLAVALIQTVSTFGTVSIPLMTGRAPDPSAMLVANQAAGWFGSLVSILSIPVAVLALLGLRYALLENLGFGDSLRSAWRVCGSHLADVVVMYLVLVLASIVVGLGIGIALTIVLVLAGLVAAAFVIAEAWAAAVAVGVIGITIGIVVAAVFQGGFAVVLSVAYTAFWRKLNEPGVPTVSESNALIAGGDVS